MKYFKRFCRYICQDVSRNPEYTLDKMYQRKGAGQPPVYYGGTVGRL